MKKMQIIGYIAKLAFILLVLLMAWNASHHQTPAMGVFSPPPNGPATSNPPVDNKAGPISISDWQQFLKDEGYECEPDGLLGKQTQKAWDEWYMNESGIYWQEKE